MKLSWFEWVCSFPVDCTKNEQRASRGSRISWLISTKSRFVVCIWYEITEWIPIRLLRHSQVLWQNLFQLYGDRMSLWVAVIVFAIWPMVWIDMGQIIIITICLFTCISFQLFKYPMLSISIRRPGVYLWKTFSDNHRHFYFYRIFKWIPQNCFYLFYYFSFKSYSSIYFLCLANILQDDCGRGGGAWLCIVGSATFLKCSMFFGIATEIKFSGNCMRNAHYSIR